MKTILKTAVLGVCMGILFILDEPPQLPPEFSLQFRLVPEAQAILGVRRRAVRRGVIIGSSVAAEDAAAASAAATTASTTTVAPASTTNAAPASTTNAAPATSPPVEGAVPIGMVVTALPTGCSVSTIKGVQYHECAGAYYRAAFQGNSLVYMVTQP